MIQDGLTLHSMKKVSEDRTIIPKGLTCGLSFENFNKGELKEGDVVECYKEVPQKKEMRFNAHPGIKYEY